MEKGFRDHSEMLACYCIRHIMDSDGNEISMRLDFMTNVRARTEGFQKVLLREAVNKRLGVCMAIKNR